MSLAFKLKLKKMSKVSPNNVYGGNKEQKLVKKLRFQVKTKEIDKSLVRLTKFKKRTSRQS